MSRWNSITKNPETETQEAKNLSMQEVESEFDRLLDTDDMINALAEQRKKEKRSHREVGNTDFYFTVYFNNAEQMSEFCNEFGLNANYIHFDGREIAKQFRRALTTPDVPKHRNQKPSKEYIEMAQGIDDATL